MTPATYAAILPLLLILASFMLKLLVGKSIKEIELLKCVVELPVDISVFCVSTIISLIITIKTGEVVASTLAFLFGAFILKVFTISLWRYCLSALDGKPESAKGVAKIYCTTVFNLTLTSFMGYYSVMLLLGETHAP